MTRSLIPALLAASVMATAFDSTPKDKMKYIPLEQIRVNPVALRDVDTDSEEFKGMVESIRQLGVLNPISVREKTDPETQQPFYELIDGLHRYTAGKAAGIATIPAQIKNAEDAKVLEMQLVGNIHRVETKPIEYTNQLIRILKLNPTLTESELSIRLGKSPAWVGERLKLLNLIPGAKTLVNDGKIVLTNAFQLAKLPKEEQDAWLVRAQTDAPDKFVPEAAARKKELDKAVRAGRATEEEKFQLVAHLQKMADIKQEAENPTAVLKLIHEHAHGNVTKAAQLALQWALSIDPETAKVREAKWTAENNRRKEEAKARAIATKEKRAKEAEERAAKVRAESEALKSGHPVAATA